MFATLTASVVTDPQSVKVLSLHHGMLKDERESKLCLGHSARLCHELNMMDEESRSSQSLFVVGLLGP